MARGGRLTSHDFRDLQKLDGDFKIHYLYMTLSFGKSPYPTKREVRKIIDSKVPFWDDM